MSNCEFCHKVLSKEKGEEDHGCLDCAGYIYIVNGVDVCFHCIEKENKNLRDKVNNLERFIERFNNDLDDISELEAAEFNELSDNYAKLSSDYEELKIENKNLRIKIANHVQWTEGFHRLERENKRLKREVEVLRLYGNKDCTAMADEVLEGEL